MNFAVTSAALGLLALAALMPFGGMGAFAAVPVTAAIVGAVALLWRGGANTERKVRRDEREGRLKIVGRADED